MGGAVVELSGRVLIRNTQIAGIYIDVNPVSSDWYSAAVSRPSAFLFCGHSPGVLNKRRFDYRSRRSL